MLSCWSNLLFDLGRQCNSLSANVSREPLFVEHWDIPQPKHVNTAAVVIPNTIVCLCKCLHLPTGLLWPAHASVAALAGGSEHAAEEEGGRGQVAVGQQAWQAAAGQGGHHRGKERKAYIGHVITRGFNRQLWILVDVWFQLEDFICISHYTPLQAISKSWDHEWECYGSKSLQSF